MTGGVAIVPPDTVRYRVVRWPIDSIWSWFTPVTRSTFCVISKIFLRMLGVKTSPFSTFSITLTLLAPPNWSAKRKWTRTNGCR